MSKIPVSMANRRGLGETTRIDIPHWRLAEKAFVLSGELTHAGIPNFERGTRRVKSLNEHSLAGGA